MRRIAAVLQIVSLWSLAGAVSAEAAAPAGDPVLAGLVEHALEHSPELAAARARAAAGARRPDEARSFPSPMVSVQYTNDGWAPSLGTMDMTTLAFMASQPLPKAGVRGLRARSLESAAEEARQRAERERLAVIEGVTRTYHELRLAQSLLEVAAEQQSLWRQIEASARARYGSGQGTQLDVLRAQVELTRSEEQRLSREADAAVRQLELNRRAGYPLDRALEGAPALALVPLGRPADELLRAAEEESPELRAVHAAAETRQLAIDLARRESGPDISVQGGYMNRGGLEPMWQAGLGVSWPLFGRGGRRAAVEAAADEHRAVGREAQAIRADLSLRIRQRLARLESLSRAAALYEQGILPQGRLALDSALAQYQAGRVPLVSVLDAMTTLLADRAAHLEHIAAHESLKARLLAWSLEADDGAMAGTGGMSRRAGAMGGGAATTMAPQGGSGTMSAAPAQSGDGTMPAMGEGR